MTRVFRHLLVVPCLLLAGCQEEGTVCAAVFGMHTVFLQDQAGDPVTDATVTPVLVRTGETLQNRTLALFAPGSHYLIDDSYTGQLRPGGDSLAVGIERGLIALELGYRFRRGDCGVEKVTGPVSVTLP